MRIFIWFFCIIQSFPDGSFILKAPKKVFFLSKQRILSFNSGPGGGGWDCAAFRQELWHQFYVIRRGNSHFHCRWEQKKDWQASCRNWKKRIILTYSPLALREIIILMNVYLANVKKKVKKRKEKKSWVVFVSQQKKKKCSDKL